MVAKDIREQTKDFGDKNYNNEMPKNFWNFWRNIQQRTIFTLMSMSGILTFVLMTQSMGVAIVAMVKSDASNSSSDNISDISDVCIINSDDETADTNSATETGYFDWEEITQGYVLSAANYGAVASGLIGARIAEIWSPKMMYGITHVAAAICHALMPLAANWNVESLIAIRVLEGLSRGSTFAVYNILLSVWIPPHERTMVGGYYYAASACGYILSSFLTGILVSNFGWESVFYIHAVIVMIWSLLWFILIYDTPETHPRISPEEKEYILSNVPKKNHVSYTVPWLAILTSGPVWAHFAMHCGNIWIVYIVLTEIPTYLKNILHYDLEKTGYMSSLPWVATFIGHCGFPALSHWLQKRGYLNKITAYRIFNAISNLGPAVSLTIINQIGCDSTAIIILLVITNFLTSAFIGGSTYNLIDLGINFTGTTSGISWTFSQAMGIISPMITSAIINHNQTLSSWSLVFYISAAVSCVPYLIFLLLGSAEEQSWNKPHMELNQESSNVGTKDVKSC